MLLFCCIVFHLFSMQDMSPANTWETRKDSLYLEVRRRPRSLRSMTMLTLGSVLHQTRRQERRQTHHKCPPVTAPNLQIILIFQEWPQDTMLSAEKTISFLVQKVSIRCTEILKQIMLLKVYHRLKVKNKLDFLNDANRNFYRFVTKFHGC